MYRQLYNTINSYYLLKNLIILRAVLKQQQNNPEWGEQVQKILERGINTPRKGTDVGDHPPITPMKHATRNELDGDAWRLYDYITRHFIATVSKSSIETINKKCAYLCIIIYIINFKYQVARDCKYLSTVIKFEIGMELFTATGRTLLDPGYTSILTWQSLGTNDTLPKISFGDKVDIQEVNHIIY